MPAPAFLRRWLAPDPPAQPTETRWANGSDGWGAVGIGGGVSRGAVAPGQAETLATVAACVGLISSAISSLPVSLTIDTPDGPSPAPMSAPAWNLLRRPNDLQSWPAFISQLVAGLLLHGNGLAFVRTDGRGAVSGLVGVPFQWVNPKIISGTSPRLAYDLVAAGPEVFFLALPGRLLDSDVMHVRTRSDNGIIGRSVLSRAGGPISEGLEIATLSEANWRNGARPSGIVTAPTFLSEVQRKTYHETFRPNFEGAINAGKTPMLEGGWAYQQIQMSSVDAELLASREFSVSDICRLFGVPEPLLQLGSRSIGDLTPFIVAFAQLTLAPIVTAIEAEFDHSVLPSGMHLTIDMDGLQRGSFSALTAAICATVQSGVLSQNDGREALGWPRSAAPGADDLRPGNAPSWPSDAQGMPHLGPSPGPRGPDGMAEPGSHHNEGSG